MLEINKKIDIPIYIINLKKDIEKKMHIQKLCKKYNLYPELIDAVDGRLLSEEEINEVYSSTKAINNIQRELSRGEIGCALSHINIYRKMVKENITEAIIVEDDIEFDNDLLKVLHKVNDFPNHWNLVLLGHHTCSARDLETNYSFWGKKDLDNKYMIVRPTEKGCGTYGYILKLEAAKILLNDLEIIEKPIDHYTGVDEKLNLYIINPAVVKINDFLSNHHHSMKDRKKLHDELRQVNKQKPIIYSRKRKALRFLHLNGIGDNINGKYIRLKHFLGKRRKYERCG